MAVRKAGARDRQADKRRRLRHVRTFSTALANPLDEVKWRTTDAIINDADGKPIFEQRNVEVPEKWSDRAAKIVASRYYRGTLGTAAREYSVRQLIGRVVNRIEEWAEKDGYFETGEDRENFAADLASLLVNQKAAFNSPVWFNCGYEENEQCSACFILSVEDSMDSILSLAKTEGMLFKYGSGTGSNLSTIRAEGEPLSRGGTATGPLSFMRGYDAFAGAIKSGGKSRRAAKMVILNADHPDILEFIGCKRSEERKAHALIDAGYDGSIDGPAYSSVFFQNSNNSVRVTDEFMEAIENGRKWETRRVTDGTVHGTVKAEAVFRAAAEAAHACGDPGIQFDTTINAWHTCPETGRINASNPCAEYMFLDDTACNLASLNLLAFADEDGAFDCAAFEQACGVMITAQEIIAGNAHYPTPKIAENSRLFRPLGLGYANLGALLMARGTAYDSPAGRNLAAWITALMTGRAYAKSAEIAAAVGPCEGAADGGNRTALHSVVQKHQRALDDIAETPGGRLAEIGAAARAAWAEAVETGAEHGYRNTQTTVLAPTGTIAFMMDCDTTGVEPEIALLKHKKLVDGGVMAVPNRIIPRTLRRLGYNRNDEDAILKWIAEQGTPEGAPGFKPEHLPVFDCALGAAAGRRAIDWRGHIGMVAAVQPFISGAVSKTINMPADSTVEDIEQVYKTAWKSDLKAVAVYRDGSKRTQPLNAGSAQQKARGRASKPVKRRLPTERKAVTHKFDIGGHTGYITVGMYDDGAPGEMFLTMSKEGSTISGFADAFAQAISHALQYGVPRKVLVNKFSHIRFEPAGLTKNPDIPIASSIVDYVFRWMNKRFPEKIEENGAENGDSPVEKRSKQAARTENTAEMPNDEDAPPCTNCGAIMIRTGTCYACANCGATSGCA